MVSIQSSGVALLRQWTDQHGKPVTFDQFVDQLAESILANLIAFDRAGIPRSDVEQIIGKDGGTLIGGGAMFQTPVETTMSDEEGRALFDSYKALLEAYDRGEIAESVIADLTDRNNTQRKVDMLLKHMGGDR